MKRIRVSADARADLDEIWSYIAFRDSESRANAVIDQLNSRLPLIASAPAIGRKRESIAPGMRSLPLGAYIIFYREMETHVSILRVVHAARSLRKLFHP
jgi:toxin ParE1/3/4